MKKLIIISGSTRVHPEPVDPIPALQRFDGVFTRLIKKYHRHLRAFDILILSPVYGLVNAKKRIAFKEPAPGSWRKLEMSESDIRRIRQNSLLRLQKLLATRQYNEIYVNVGKSMLRMIEGFDRLVPRTTKIMYSQGRGIGPKMAHMKEWIESRIL